MSSFEQRSCFSCGNPVDDQPCRYCTCERCGYYNRGVPCLGCNSEAENSFTYEPTPYSYNDSPNFSDYPPQPQYDTYFCELCGNDAHYGYDCPPQVPFVYDQDPCFNQNFDNNFPQTSPSFPQQFPCCENYGGPRETFQCQPMSQNYYEPNHCYNSNSSGFDQFQPPQFPVIHQPPQETNTEILQARENLMEAIQAFLKKYDHIPPREKCMALLLAEERFLKVKQALEEGQNQPENVQELLLKLLNDLQILNKMQLKQEEQAAKICTPYWKCPIFDDDDNEEYTIQVREYYKNSPVAITPDFPITNSLIIKDEHLDTIPETESDEENESSVDDLNLTSSESEDLSDIEKSDLIESLINKDTVITSLKIDFLLEEFAGELALINLIPPGIAETNFDPKEDIRLIKKLLYDNSSPRPPKELNYEISDAIIESLSSSHIPVKDSNSLMEEIDIFLAADDSIPPGIDSNGYDSEEDNIFLEYEPDPGELTRVVVEDVLPTHPTLCQDLDFTLFTDFSRSDLVVSFPSRNRNKTFDPRISIEVQSKRFLSLNKFSISFISDPLSPVLKTLLPFSSEIEDKVFNP
ncbi:hypothetical protein Tco_0358954 [Tanacetum coccineum]